LTGGVITWTRGKNKKNEKGLLGSKTGEKIKENAIPRLSGVRKQNLEKCREGRIDFDARVYMKTSESEKRSL